MRKSRGLVAVARPYKKLRRLVIQNLVREFKAYLRDTNSSVPFPPATEAVVRETEAALGFQIPTFLKRVYLEIGNGGFGPGYGIIGLKGGYPSDAGTLVEAYNGIKRAAEDDSLPWPREYLPFCEWGCTIFSCVDCANPDGNLYRCEACELTPVNYTLEEFMRMWMQGVSILDHDDGHRETKEITNPFTRKKFTVKGGRKKK